MDIAETPQGFSITIDADGSPQVFSAPDLRELCLKLATAQGHATDKIRELGELYKLCREVIDLLALLLRVKPEASSPLAQKAIKAVTNHAIKLKPE